MTSESLKLYFSTHDYIEYILCILPRGMTSIYIDHSWSFQDPRVEDALGAPIKGYGEETTRRRRTHVSHAVYEKDGVKHMRMRFYIQGVRNKGVVELDMKKVSLSVVLFDGLQR